jgi:hypothetical protein
MILGSDPGMVNEWDGDLKPSEMFGTALSGGRLRVGWKGSETGKDTGSRRIQPFVKPQSVADTDHAVRTVEGEVAVPSMVRSRTNIGFGCQAMAFGEYLETAGTYCRRPFSESWRNPSTVPREHQRSRSN